MSKSFIISLNIFYQGAVAPLSRPDKLVALYGVKDAFRLKIKVYGHTCFVAGDKGQSALTHR